MPGLITGFVPTGINHTPFGIKLEYYFYEFVNTLLLVATRDPRIEEIDRTIKAFNLSIREISRSIGMSHTALRHWLESPSARPRDDEQVDRVLNLVREKKGKLSTQSQTGRQSNTTPVYTGTELNLDSAQLNRLLEMTSRTQITVEVVDPKELWSAKNVTTKMIIGSAYPGAAGRAIQLSDGIGNNLFPGQTLVFRRKEDDYLAEDLYMIFSNGEQELIGWFDPLKDSRSIQTTTGSVPLSDWKATHEAFAVMWGKFGELTENRVSLKGIGPSTRI